MAKVTNKERNQAKQERLYGARVATTREKLFYKPYDELAKSLTPKGSNFSQVDDFKKSVDKNIDKVFKPLIQKSLFDCWRLNIDQFTDYFIDVWKRNINVDKIQPIKSKMLDRFLKKYSAKKVTSISDTTRSIIKNRVDLYTSQGMSYNDMVKAIVKDTKGEIKKTRAGLIAREETSQSMSETNRVTAEESGLKFKKWIYRGGGKTKRPNHQTMDGVKIKIKDKFNVPGHGKVASAKLNNPKDINSNNAGQIINCY